MKVFIKSCSLFLCSILLFSTSGCIDEINKVMTDKEPFKLEKFIWKSVPSNIQDQAMGSNCEFMPINDETELYMTGGLIKINGIYEILEEKLSDNSDYNKQVFENSRWIILIEMNTDNTNNNQVTGTLTLRSKEKDGASTVQVKRFCGT